MKWLAVIVCSLGLVSAAQALEVYRWIDESGHPHYSQSAPIGVDAELIDIESGRASSETSAQAAERKLALDAALKAGREAREEDRIAREESQVSDEEGKKECAQMQRMREQFVNHSRVYDSAEDRYLSETERQSRIGEIGAFLSQNCD